MFEFELGVQVKDKVTPFKGIVTARTQYLNGCLQYCVKSQKLKDSGDPLDDQWFDEGQLTKTGPGISSKIKAAEEPPGGPRTTPPGACAPPS